MVKKVSKKLYRPFVCIYTDVKVKNNNGRSESNDEISFEEIRKFCIDNLKGLVKDDTDIYVIDNNDSEKYDFNSLRDGVISKLQKRQKEYFLHSLNRVIYGNKQLTEEDRLLEEAKFHVDKCGLIDIDDFIQNQLESRKKIEINLALTGRVGTGKSSFINATIG